MEVDSLSGLQQLLGQPVAAAMVSAQLHGKIAAQRAQGSALPAPPMLYPGHAAQGYASTLTAAQREKLEADTAVQRDKVERLESERIDRDVGQAESVDTFTDYFPADPRIKSLGKKHPDAVVEATSMASVPAPNLDSAAARIALPKPIIEGGLLSSLQLESIIYANYRHSIRLPGTNARSGFLLGDGAGIGKGRQISGLVYDNYIRGRTKSIWFSASADLKADAERDFSDIGASKMPLISLAELKSSEKLWNLHPKGVMFSTYTCLVSSGGKGNQSRLEQLVDWCTAGRTEEFHGCIMFDECHKAKNLNLKNDQKSTKTSRCVKMIQELLPNARVVYVSATGASQLSHLCYMDRLGLWGPGTSFANAKDFVHNIADKGVGAMELVAMDMKARGLFLARSLSYRGTEFEIEDVAITVGYKAIYDTCCDIWQQLEIIFDKAIADGHLTKKKASSAFWGDHQRFFRELTLGAKIPKVIERAEEQIAKGLCVVIGLQSTGEAGMKEALETVGFGGKMVSVAKVLLLRTLRKVSPYFPVPCSTLEDKINDLDLPMTPLDLLVDGLGGPASVAEMTGRKERIVRTSRNGSDFCIEKRHGDDSSADSINNSEKKQFQSGKKLVAIISEAASTGVSLQADRRVNNQRRRYHITLELPWSADKAVQQLGRSHRSNQTSAPHYQLMISEIGGEHRFASAVAERIQQLGALTKGDRRASANIKEGEESGGLDTFALDDKLGKLSLLTLVDNLKAMGRSGAMKTTITSEFLLQRKADVADDLEAEASRGCDPAVLKSFAIEAIACMVHVQILHQDKSGIVKLSETGKSTAVKRFLNRLFGIQLDLQQKIFQFFTDTYEYIKREAETTGSFSNGIVDVAGEDFTVEDRKTLHQDPQSGAHSEIVQYSVDRGITWEVAKCSNLYQPGHVDGKEKYEKAKENNQAVYFLRGKSKPFGHPKESDAMTLALAIGRTRGRSKHGVSRFFRLVKPNTGVETSGDAHIDDIKQKYKEVRLQKDLSEWDTLEAQWRKAWSNEGCLHFNCNRAGCAYGARKKTQYVVSGALLGVWRVIADIKDRSWSKKASEMKIVRISLNEGTERIVGVHLHGEEQRDTMLASLADKVDSGCGPRSIVTARTKLSDEESEPELWEEVTPSDRTAMFTIRTTTLAPAKDRSSQMFVTHEMSKRNGKASSNLVLAPSSIAAEVKKDSTEELVYQVIAFADDAAIPDPLLSTPEASAWSPNPDQSSWSSGTKSDFEIAMSTELDEERRQRDLDQSRALAAVRTGSAAAATKDYGNYDLGASRWRHAPKTVTPKEAGLNKSKRGRARRTGRVPTPNKIRAKARGFKSMQLDSTDESDGDDGTIFPSQKLQTTMATQDQKRRRVKPEPKLPEPGDAVLTRDDTEDSVDLADDDKMDAGENDSKSEIDCAVSDCYDRTDDDEGDIRPLSRPLSQEQLQENLDMQSLLEEGRKRMEKQAMEREESQANSCASMVLDSGHAAGVALAAEPHRPRAYQLVQISGRGLETAPIEAMITELSVEVGRRDIFHELKPVRDENSTEICSLSFFAKNDGKTYKVGSAEECHMRLLDIPSILFELKYSYDSQSTGPTQITALATKPPVYLDCVRLSAGSPTPIENESFLSFGFSHRMAGGPRLLPNQSPKYNLVFKAQAPLGKKAKPGMQRIEFLDRKNQVSRTHCELKLHEPSQTFAIIDKSRNGVFVNMKKIAPETEVKIAVGSTIVLGESDVYKVGNTLPRIKPNVYAFRLVEVYND